MNWFDTRLARNLARDYRNGNITLRQLHDIAHHLASQLISAAPEVWLSAVMQLAKS